MTQCIECAYDLTPNLNDPLMGEILDCPDCAAELEVVNLDPVELDLAPEVAEDWGE